MLPASLKYICHNGAGYDNVDIQTCTKKGTSATLVSFLLSLKRRILTNPGIAVSSTPVAVNHATADVGIFLMIGALRQAYVPLAAIRAGESPSCSLLSLEI